VSALRQCSHPPVSLQGSVATINATEQQLRRFTSVNLNISAGDAAVRYARDSLGQLADVQAELPTGTVAGQLTPEQEAAFVEQYAPADGCVPQCQQQLLDSNARIAADVQALAATLREAEALVLQANASLPRLREDQATVGEGVRRVGLALRESALGVNASLLALDGMLAFVRRCVIACYSVL
jgi:hypothetical protein